MNSVLRKCDQCAEVYDADSRYLARGQGRFCSRSCAGKWNGTHRFKAQELNAQCAWCGEKFHRAESKLKKVKSGLFFCCREHKDFAQRISTGISAIHPPQYGTENSRYRLRAIEFYGSKCQNCNWNDQPAILEVNHKNFDRQDNNLNNLEVLCPTCHRFFHWATSTSGWRGKPLPMTFAAASKLWYRDLSVYFRPNL